MVLSSFFLLIQIVVLFDFAFRWSESWGKKAIEEGKNLWWGKSLPSHLPCGPL